MLIITVNSKHGLPVLNGPNSCMVTFWLGKFPTPWRVYSYWHVHSSTKFINSFPFPFPDSKTISSMVVLYLQHVNWGLLLQLSTLQDILQKWLKQWLYLYTFQSRKYPQNPLNPCHFLSNITFTVLAFL